MTTMSFENDFTGEVIPDDLSGLLGTDDPVSPEQTDTSDKEVDADQLTEEGEDPDDIHPYYFVAEGFTEGMMTLFEDRVDDEERMIIRAMILSQVIGAYNAGLTAAISQMSGSRKKDHSHHGFQRRANRNGSQK